MPTLAIQPRCEPSERAVSGGWRNFRVVIRKPPNTMRHSRLTPDSRFELLNFADAEGDAVRQWSSGRLSISAESFGLVEVQNAQIPGRTLKRAISPQLEELIISIPWFHVLTNG